MVANSSGPLQELQPLFSNSDKKWNEVDDPKSLKKILNFKKAIFQVSKTKFILIINTDLIIYQHIWSFVKRNGVRDHRKFLSLGSTFRSKSNSSPLIQDIYFLLIISNLAVQLKEQIDLNVKSGIQSTKAVDWTTVHNATGQRSKWDIW